VPSAQLGHWLGPVTGLDSPKKAKIWVWVLNAANPIPFILLFFILIFDLTNFFYISENSKTICRPFRIYV
jgi:hypothetical protein